MSSLETWVLSKAENVARQVGLFHKVVDQYGDELQVLRDVMEGVLDASLLDRITKTDLPGLLDATTNLALSKQCFKTIGEMASIQQDFKRRDIVKQMKGLGGPRMPRGVFPEYERLVDQFELLSASKHGHKASKSLAAWTRASTRDLVITVKRDYNGSSWVLESPSKHRLVLPSNTVWTDTNKQSFGARRLEQFAAPRLLGRLGADYRSRPLRRLPDGQDFTVLLCAGCSQP